MLRLLAAASVLATTLLAPRAAWALDDEVEVCTYTAESITPRVAVVLAQDLAPVDDGGQVPWCVSPDDPRCSPMDGGPLSPQVTAQPKLSVIATPRAVGAYALEPPAWPRKASSDDIRPGSHLRIERPPRDDRWNA
jgi:hypothetical protein